MLKNWPSTGTEMPLAGSTIEAKPRPICIASSWPETMNT